MSANADNHDHGSDAHAHHGLSVPQYTLVFAALVTLTFTTYWTAHQDFGSFNLPLALGIATLKCSIVCAFFMHLWGDTAANKFVLILSVLFVILMISLTLADVNTRFPLTAPPNSERFKVPAGGQLE